MPLPLFLKSSRTRVGLSLLLMLTGATSAVQAAEASPASAFTAAQQEQIGKVAEDYLAAHPEKMGEAVATYLAEHPEFLVAAGESLHQQQQLAQQQAMVQMVMQHQTELLDINSPSVGPADAKATVVMFFDYQCSYCSKMAPVVEALVKANTDVRFVFKELPIFASRWPVSALAARAGEQVWLNKGGAAYLAYHNGLYATGKVEGAMTEKEVHAAAKPYLNDKTFNALKQAQESGKIHDALQANMTLAQQMRLTGTPVFVVLPQAKKPDAQRISVVPDATSQETLQMAIQKARG